MSQNMLKVLGKTDKFIIRVGSLSTIHSVIDRSNKEKVNKNVVNLNRTINKSYLIDIYRILHQTTAKYTFFSRSCGTSTNIDV